MTIKLSDSKLILKITLRKAKWYIYESDYTY